MGRRGPPPTPTSWRILHGNPGKRPFNTREPQPRNVAPRCPAWLPPRAKAVWKRVVPELKRARVLSAIDGEALALLCTSYVRWQDAEEFLEKHGTVYPIRGADGQIRCFQQFPQVSIARNMALLVRGMLLEFGMTPAARSRVELPWVEGPADVDPDCTRDRFGNPI